MTSSTTKTTNATTGTTGGVRRRRESPLNPHSDTFRQFADLLYAGLLIFTSSLLVITWFASLSAAVAVLRDSRRTDDPFRAGTYLRVLLARLRYRWVSHLIVPTAVLGLLVVDLLVLPFVVPSPTIALAIVALLATAALTIGFRYAAALRDTDQPGEHREPGLSVWQRSSARCTADASGTALLAFGILTSGAITFIAPLLIVVMGGATTLAVVAVEHRADRRAQQGTDVRSA